MMDESCKDCDLEQDHTGEHVWFLSEEAMKKLHEGE